MGQQYPGTEPVRDPVPAITADRSTLRLDDAGSPLGRGRRRHVVEEARPITNAQAGGAPGSIDLAIPPVKGRRRLGSGGSELEFPSRTTRLGAGVRAEDIEPNVTLVRIELAGRPPMVVRAFGHDQPARWAAYVSSPLARGTRVTSVVALDAAGRAVAESEHDQYLSHPACTIFR